MAKKIKKISINALEKAVEGYETERHIEWNGIDITVKRLLSLTEMLTFVNSVAASCFSAEDNTYTPEAREFAVQCEVLEMYANFSLPSNTDKKYELVSKAADIIGIIIGNVDREQFECILRTIDERIEYMKELSISSANADAESAIREIESLGNELKDIFSGVTADDVKSVIQSIADGQFDEGKLIDAYLQKRYETDESAEIAGADTDGE